MSLSCVAVNKLMGICTNPKEMAPLCAAGILIPRFFFHFGLSEIPKCLSDNTLKHFELKEYPLFIMTSNSGIISERKIQSKKIAAAHLPSP